MHIFSEGETTYREYIMPARAYKFYLQVFNLSEILS